MPVLTITAQVMQKDPYGHKYKNFNKVYQAKSVRIASDEQRRKYTNSYTILTVLEIYFRVSFHNFCP